MNDQDFHSDYRPSEGEPYMNPDQLAYFREKLVEWRKRLLREVHENLDRMKEDKDKVADWVDQGALEADSVLEFRTRDRSRKILGEIDAALARIEDGSYGYCEETGEEIGLKRLEARPIATFTIEAQERMERMEKMVRNGR